VLGNRVDSGKIDTDSVWLLARRKQPILEFSSRRITHYAYSKVFSAPAIATGRRSCAAEKAALFSVKNQVGALAPYRRTERCPEMAGKQTKL
jgi:hypothetical protein